MTGPARPMVVSPAFRSELVDDIYDYYASRRPPAPDLTRSWVAAEGLVHARTDCELTGKAPPGLHDSVFAVIEDGKFVASFAELFWALRTRPCRCALRALDDFPDVGAVLDMVEIVAAAEIAVRCPSKVRDWFELWMVLRRRAPQPHRDDPLVIRVVNLLDTVLPLPLDDIRLFRHAADVRRQETLSSQRSDLFERSDLALAGSRRVAEEIWNASEPKSWDDRPVLAFGRTDKVFDTMLVRSGMLVQGPVPRTGAPFAAVLPLSLANHSSAPAVGAFLSKRLRGTESSLAAEIVPVDGAYDLESLAVAAALWADGMAAAEAAEVARHIVT